MPISPTYPGVYIEEIPSGVRTIMGVSTSVAAFIDYFKNGPMNKAVQIFNMGDFEREFGGLDSSSEASYAIQQFFLNGGSEAWVVRTATGTVSKPLAKAKVTILSLIGGATALSVEAINEGDWGNNLQVKIDYNTADPASLFNMKVSEYTTVRGTLRLSRYEVFSNLSINQTSPRFVQTVINDEDSGSKLIRVSDIGTSLPLQNGTVSGDLSTFAGLTKTKPGITVTIGTGTSTEGTAEAILDIKGANPSTLTLDNIVPMLEKAIRSSKPDNPAFASAIVERLPAGIRVLAGPTSASSVITFSPSGANPTLKELKLDSSPQIEGVISGDLSTFPTLTSDPSSLNITIGGENHEITFAAPTTLSEARIALETSIRAAASSNAAFSGVRVSEYSNASENRLIILPGLSNQDISFTSTLSDTTTLNELKLGTADIGSVNGVVSGDLSTWASLTADTASLDLKIGNEGPHTATFTSKPSSLTDARAKLETVIKAAHSSTAFTSARVAIHDSSRLVVAIENGSNAVVFTATPLDSATVSELKLGTGQATANIQEYKLGSTAAILNTAQGAGVKGSNGVPPVGNALIGNLADKTGLYALEDVDLFNILCIPRTSIVTGNNSLTATEANMVMSVAIKYCENRRAFFIVDTPNNISDVQKVKEWLGKTNIRHKNAALYFPRIKVADTLNEFRLRSFGASGTVAGLYSRTDSNRGIWKAPAGTEAALVNVQGLDYTLTDDQNGTLNPLAINCLRNFRVYGNVCWGGRTLDGADQMASEWKYIPVRRLALYLEESLYRGTKWVVFEPNDEPLWSQIRLNIGAFMHSLFRQGAFQGQTPKDAYFVKCDKETTTQDDRNRGIVNIMVGFAPLKPAEFVIIKIQQMAGQIQT
ncbi:Phage tail sheath protein subtilisin-like domain protein [uncultured archaeon]|nr:Phage tail sheath protein subtilisin-like domain protein [uncultured archaeon]